MTRVEQGGDAAIRSLERAIRAAPGDAASRLKLATALARSGRAPEALASLDLATFPDAAFGDARRLADELWALDVATLEPAATIPLEDEAEVLAAAMDAAGRVAFVTGEAELVYRDTATGAQTQIAGDPDYPLAALVFTRAALLAQNLRGRVTRIALEDGAREDFPCDGILEGASPAGDLVHLARFAKSGVHRLATLAPVLEWPRETTGLKHPIVWWEGERILRDTGSAFAVSDFDGAGVATLERCDAWELTRAGPGLVARLAGELTLHDLRDGRAIPVIERAWARESWRLPPPSLAADGRTLRLLMGHKVRTATLDAARVVTPASERRAWLSELRSSEASPALWHPEAPLAFVAAPGVLGSVELRGPAGLVRELEGKPIAWSQDGRSLLVEQPLADPPRLEVWRTRSSRENTSRMVSP